MVGEKLAEATLLGKSAVSFALNIILRNLIPGALECRVSLIAT